MTTRELTAQALKLSVKSRAKLATEILASLEDTGSKDATEIWIDEASRRLKAYKCGRMAGNPADVVLQKARGKIK